MSPRPAFDALQISALATTATLLKSVRIGDEVVVGGQTDVLRIKTLDDIPFGHKISLRDIRSKDSIVKYGEVIGSRTCAKRGKQSRPRRYDSTKCTDIQA